MYYHIKIELKSGKSRHGEVKTDLAQKQLIARYVEPYDKGESFVINGKTVVINDIERVQISQSEQIIESYIPAIRARERNSNVLFLDGPSYVQQAVSQAEDVTDEFIKGPPGYKKHLLAKDDVSAKRPLNKSKVFIVHGHDKAAKMEVARFVEKLGLQAIILHEKASLGQTIIEKIEHYSDVGFAIVLYTPDDVGHVKGKADEMKRRARQNVVFEHGYLIGKLGRKNVAALIESPIELPNDISGVVYIKIDEAGAWHLQLAREMKDSGYDIDMNNLI